MDSRYIAVLYVLALYRVGKEDIYFADFEVQFEVDEYCLKWTVPYADA